MYSVRIIARVAGAAFLTAGLLTVVARSAIPKSSDVMAGAIHFKKGLEEFQKGCMTVLFGAPGASDEEKKRRKEESRIVIE